MSKKIVIANWKMNPLSLKEAEKLFSDIAKLVLDIKKTKIVVCPPIVYTEKLKKLSLGCTGKARKIILGVQDAFYEDMGAYTGKISTEMLYNIGARYIILGHSETRALGDTNQDVNKKIKSSLKAGLSPVLCIGENVRDENHEYLNAIKTQIFECLNGVSKASFSKIIIAYEPIWSISTTVNHHNATPTDSIEMIIFIKKVLSDISSPDIAQSMRMIYGGSVNKKNTFDFLKNGGVSGVLIGKASLDAKEFSEIVKITENEIN